MSVVMSILTASNPLILALVLSLYHFSKESSRILKLKKILICSMVGYFTLHGHFQLVLIMLEKHFWHQTECFGVRGIIGDNFQEPQIDLKAKNRPVGAGWRVCRRPRTTSWIEIVTFVLIVLET